MTQPALEFDPHSAARRMTYEEFLNDPTIEYAEWVNGEVVQMTNPSFQHQEVLIFLASVLHFYVRRARLGKVVVAPFQMKVGTSGRQPDLIFVSNANLSKIKRQHVEGAADLAVEIISPDSIRRDREQKFREYQAAGVWEYWIIDPESGSADFFALDADGAYERIDPVDGKIASRAIVGLWLDPAWLFCDPLPDEAEIYKAWGLM